MVKMLEKLEKTNKVVGVVASISVGLIVIAFSAVMIKASVSTLFEKKKKNKTVDLGPATNKFDELYVGGIHIAPAERPKDNRDAGGKAKAKSSKSSDSKKTEENNSDDCSPAD